MSNDEQVKLHEIARWLHHKEEAVRELLPLVREALSESAIFCLGCAKGENVVTPPRSDVVGLAAVHGSGLICIPNTIIALLKERGIELAPIEAKRKEVPNGR